MGFDLASLIISLQEQLHIIAYFVLTAVIFAESGLFFGFFLPGDSLLITVGLLSTQGYFRVEYFLILLPLAAIAGDSIGYWMGRIFGKRFFNKKNSFIFNKNRVTRAERFYKKHGAKTIILARFVPLIRTFAPIVAGIAMMPYKRFLVFSIFGGTFWTCGMLLLGYFLGNAIPNIDKYLGLVIVLIIFLSLVPALFERFGTSKQK